MNKTELAHALGCFVLTARERYFAGHRYIRWTCREAFGMCGAYHDACAVRRAP